MAKLNQILAIDKGVKSAIYSEFSEANKMVKKPELFTGFSKTYQPLAEDGEQFPPESKRVQLSGASLLMMISVRLTELFDITARKDFTNCITYADVVVDGVTLFQKAPVSYLLFLEKQITDVRTFVENLPVLDEADDWTFDSNAMLYKAAATQTHKTKKVQKPIVLYDATAQHPAQTQLITEDVTVGYWTTVKHSGGISKTRKLQLQERLDRLMKAVKMAREEANVVDEIPTGEPGKAIFNYLLAE